MSPNTSTSSDPIPSFTPRKCPVERSAVTTPPLTPSSTTKSLKLDYMQQTSSLKIITALTPPNSPILVRSTNGFEDPVKPRKRASSATPTQRQNRSSFYDSHDSRKDVPLVVECPFEVEVTRDRSNHPQIFGKGAWSTVYRGAGRTRSVPPAPSSNVILTPPPSPGTSVPLVVAIKAPLSKASRTILYNEAITLSHLSRTPYHDSFIIPFYGYVPTSSSLILAPIPLSLSEHISSCVRMSRANNTQSSSQDPVIGSNLVWLSLAAKLIAGLAWLHNDAFCVHGDLKPGNILLSPNGSSEGFAFDPLLIDFSSSHLLSSTENPPNTLSALTREYTAPELLSPSVLRNPSSTATTKSDVFSLAVTLIVAATGELMVYHGNVWQRQHMATQSWNVLEFVRNGDSRMRVPTGGIVERVAVAAVRRSDQGRIDAVKWKGLVSNITREEVGIRK
jgi:Protein kinase domain